MKIPPHCVTWFLLHPAASVVKSSECTSCHCFTPLTLTPPTASTAIAMTFCEPKRSVFVESSANNGVLCGACMMRKFAAESRPIENSDCEPKKIMDPSASVLATFNERIVSMPRGLSCGPVRPSTGSSGVGGHPGSSFGTLTNCCALELRGCGPPPSPCGGSGATCWSGLDGSGNCAGGGGIVGMTGGAGCGGRVASTGRGGGVTICTGKGCKPAGGGGSLEGGGVGGGGGGGGEKTTGGGGAG